MGGFCACETMTNAASIRPVDGAPVDPTAVLSSSKGSKKRQSSPKAASIKAVSLCDDENLSRFREVLRSSFENSKTAFRSLDRDGDSVITVEEWLAALRELGKSTGWDDSIMPMVSTSGAALFGQIDSNHDGKLTYKEFREGLAKRLQDPPRKDKPGKSGSPAVRAHRQAVARTESPKSPKSLKSPAGHYAMAKLRKVLKEGYTDLDDAFQALDTDGDSMLSISELKEWLFAMGKGSEWPMENVETLEAAAMDIFNGLDVNDDGTVTRKEFMARLTATLQ